ncbi:hypothetical protein LUZ61_019462 [Rhynchospora tenuis]|uniref:Protein kinase domain-containing protein n=1 Tax=Rhynchospora tenuis TaxID=198213 RepID=A0AAD5ZB76_9POAL|nr:hypothetical protein LUZ61_019462 [Rhynchospora tenuis]
MSQSGSLSSTSGGTDTTSQTYAQSSDFSSDQSSGSVRSTLSTSSPKSTQKRKKRVSDVILSCIGLGSDDKVQKPPSPNTLRNKKTSFEVISGNVRFTWGEILRATSWFAPDLIVGEGGSSIVYRGKLDNGKDVAVKRAKKNANDENLTNESFRTEIATLQQISHINLVGFYGYLLFEDEKIIVLEWVTNGNLRQHLDCQYGKVLEFTNRLDIIIDVAHAITYLHTYCDKPLIHRDIKSSNILLTSTLHGKIADFGLAKLASTEAGDTVVQTMAKGTHGYVDPEYFKTNQVTNKSDVYSYGVVLLEIVTGKRPTDRIGDHFMVDWAMTEFCKGNGRSTIDPKLAIDSAITVAAERIYDLAYRCLNSDRRKRPYMDECGRILWNIRKTYNDLARNAS